MCDVLALCIGVNSETIYGIGITLKYQWGTQSILLNIPTHDTKRTQLRSYYFQDSIDPFS